MSLPLLPQNTFETEYHFWSFYSLLFSVKRLIPVTRNGTRCETRVRKPTQHTWKIFRPGNSLVYVFWERLLSASRSDVHRCSYHLVGFTSCKSNWSIVYYRPLFLFPLDTSCSALHVLFSSGQPCRRQTEISVLLRTVTRRCKTSPSKSKQGEPRVVTS